MSASISNALAQFCAALGGHGGAIVGAGVLAAVLLLNQFIFRHRWQSYPTLAQCSADHPDSVRAEGIVCHDCGTKAARAGVSGKGDLDRCNWCETELFRIDR